MIRILKPQEEDIRGIQEVFYKTWLVTYPNAEAGITVDDIEERFKNSFSEEGIERRRKEIFDKSDDILFLVAKDEAAVVGVCVVKKLENFNELRAIYVLPDYHRKGIGTMFWEKVMEYFEAEKDIIVQLATYNEQAINFYKKLGFIDTGKRFTQENLKMTVSGSYIPEMEMIIKADCK